MDLEVEIVVDSAGYHGCYGGLPESSYPGEGAEWSVVEDVGCPGCGRVWGDDGITGHFGAQIEERIQESRYVDDE